MSRYVEAETLVRWICGNKCGCERDECGYDIPCQQVQLLEGAPSIDIVFCKECKHRINDDDFQEKHICLLRRANGGKFCKDDDFCSYGEREGE